MSPEELFLLFLIAPLSAGFIYLVALSKRLKRGTWDRHRAEFERAVGDKLRSAQAPNDSSCAD